MSMIWVVVTLSMLLGAYALIGGESAPVPPAPGEMSLALNMSDYRRAVMAYALAHPAFTGSVPNANLQLANNVAPDAGWRNYVVPNQGYAGSQVVIYAVSGDRSAIAADIERLAGRSALAGVALNGLIVSPGNPAVPLPAGVAPGVPDGAPVWLAQAYARPRRRRSARGFTMIEVLAALALAAVMIAGMATMISSSLNDTRAQQAALYQTRLAAAARQLIQQNYTPLLQATSGAPLAVGLSSTGPYRLSSYLASATGPTNPYGQAPCLLIYASNPAGALQALLVTEGGDSIPDVDLGYIAANAGQGGGSIQSLGNANGAAAGAYGSWKLAQPNPAGLSCTGKRTGVGHIATLITSDALQQQNSDYLYRVAVPGDPAANTMQVPIVLANSQTDFSSCSQPGAIAGDALGNVLDCEVGPDGVQWLPQASFHWREPVQAAADLVTANAHTGDVVMTLQTNRAYTFNGQSWQALAVDESGQLTLGNGAIAGAACGPNPASGTQVTTNAQGDLLTCVAGTDSTGNPASTWQYQKSEIDTPSHSTDSDCAIEVAQDGATDFPCHSAPSAAPVFVGSIGYWESVVRRDLPALPRNGMASIYAWAHMQDAFVTECPGQIRDVSNGQGAYETLYAMVVDKANPDTPLISAVTQSSKIIADLANINVSLTAPLPRLDANGNVIQYQVVLETFWIVYGGADPTSFRPSYCGTGNNIVPVTGLVTSWTITPFY